METSDFSLIESPCPTAPPTHVVSVPRGWKECSYWFYLQSTCFHCSVIIACTQHFLHNEKKIRKEKIAVAELKTELHYLDFAKSI